MPVAALTAPARAKTAPVGPPRRPYGPSRPDRPPRGPARSPRRPGPPRPREPGRRKPVRGRAPARRATRRRFATAFPGGRGWIALIATLLAGIVFFNVGLLELNRDITSTAERTAELKRESSQLRGHVARLGSSERIQRVAAERGLVHPQPADVRYLSARPGVDARRAAKRVE